MESFPALKLKIVNKSIRFVVGLHLSDYHFLSLVSDKKLQDFSLRSK